MCGNFTERVEETLLMMIFVQNHLFTNNFIHSITANCLINPIYTNPNFQLINAQNVTQNQKQQIRKCKHINSDYFIQQRMHALKGSQLADTTNPYIQIMFNINSKNVVNNNIVGERQREAKGGGEIEQEGMGDNKVNSEKNGLIDNRSKINKSVMSKGNVTMVNTTRQDIHSQDPPITKPKKKPIPKPTHKPNLTASQSHHRSSKNTVHKKYTSQGFSKLNPSQQAQLSQKKQLTTKSRGKLKATTSNGFSVKDQKDTREKIIELMIRDYQKGSITADNLKEAIKSLIDRETNNEKRLMIKTQHYNNSNNSRSEKCRTRIPTSYKNSLAASLHTTPKHKPSKSKSQKFHSHQPSMILKLNKQSSNQEPQIIERVIHNKQFMSKIIIKGINSSLFLSNDWGESEVRERRQREEVSVNVINTSDSVKDLKRGMREVMVQGREEMEKEIYDSVVNGFVKVNQQKQKDTKNILANFLDQLKRSSSRNQFISSGQSLGHQQSLTSSQNSLKYLTRIKEDAIGNDDLIQNQPYQQQQQQQQQHYPNSLDQFYVKQDDDRKQQQSEFLKIEQLQRQYALLLKDRRSQGRSGSGVGNESGEQYRQHMVRNNNENFLNKQQQVLQQQKQLSPRKIKSYVSSQLQNKLQSSGPLSQFKQQLNQKRAKSITQSEIKKLNQIMDVIKDQLSKKQSITTNDTKDSQVLEKIVTLLEAQRMKVQQELKLYGQFQNKKVSEDSSSSIKENSSKQESIEQNQIINSFQKKLKKKLTLNQSTHPLQPQPNYLKIYYQSNQLKSPASSSRKSLSSNASSHHLQKIKISQLNLDEIQLGLRKRLNELQAQRQQQYSIITQKFINDKITPKQYQEEKQIIEKWFEIEAKELRRIKKNLLEGYKKAKEVISKNELVYDSRLTKEKSTKMIKCISQKYLNNKIANNNTIENAQTIKITTRVQQTQNPPKKPTNKPNLQKPTSNFSHPQKHYQTIEQLQQDLLIRNITPIQKFLYVQRQQKQLDALSPLSIQQSGISQQVSNNNTTLNNSNHMPEMLMTLQECERSQEGSKEFMIRNRKPDSRKKDYTNQDQKQEQSPSYQYQQVKYKRPCSAKLNSQIAHYLNKYQQSVVTSSDEKIMKEKDLLMMIDREDKENQQNQSSSNSQTEYLQEEYGDGQDEADNQESSNEEEYYGYNDTEEEGSIDIDKTLHKVNNDSPQSITYNQQSLTSSQGLILQQPPHHPHIIINKPTLSSDQLFSPKKPTVHQQFSQQLLQYNSTDADHQKVSLEFTQLNKEFNETVLKLKYLTEEDKDDIFEFMFLDLCLELFLEQTKNNRIMKSIERFLVWQRRKKKIPKGFKTGLECCKTYITHIQQFLLKNHLQTLKRLQSPMGPSAKQMLKFMRDYDDISQQSSQIQTINLVLPIEIYQKFQSQPVNKLQVERYYDDQQKQQSRLKFLKSLKHFHNKAMFDSLNEMLDLERCYGIWGKPFPWKKVLDVDRTFGQEDIKRKLKHAADKLVENCSYFCGVLVDKEESVFGKSNVSEEYLHHIREDRMSKMLSNDMIDNEDRWIFYDDQETQVLVSLSKSITADLITEVLQQMKVISWKK